MDLKLPPLGEGADSGTVVNLFVKEGDQIAKDQPILELENEKAVATIPASAAGVVGQIFVKTGDKINVGQRILALNEAGAKEPTGAERKPASKRPAREQEPAEAPPEREEEEEQEQEQEHEEERPPRAG